MQEQKSINNESFEALIGPHISAVKAVARRILGDDDAASDAVQEALITLWNTDAVPPNLRRWLIRTVIHRSLHARRSRMRRRGWEQLGGNGVLACALCDPEREMEIRDLIDRLEFALNELPSEYRKVFELRELEGLGYREISDVLGAPVGTVRSRLSRARAQVRATGDDTISKVCA